MLQRCWVCGEAVRCTGCQQCLRCEDLLDDLAAARVRTTAPSVRVPSVRLRRARAEARPRPTPPTPAPSPTPTRTGRFHAKRAGRPVQLPSLKGLSDAVWYVRAAVVPGLMVLAAYLAHGYFRSWSGLGLAAACIAAFYLPYVVLTPVRRKGEFFPLGEEGPGLPVVMVIGGALVGGICGIVLGLFGGERIALWGGGIIAGITFHVIYYGTVGEKSRSQK